MTKEEFLVSFLVNFDNGKNYAVIFRSLVTYGYLKAITGTKSYEVKKRFNIKGREFNQGIWITKVSIWLVA